MRAEPEKKPSADPNLGSQATPTPTTPSAPPSEEVQSSGLKDGQGTAIVTGAISIILGLAYIAITVALDSRGELLPPPPEAFQ